MIRRHSEQALIDAVRIVSSDAAIKATKMRDSERDHVVDCLNEIVEMLKEAKARKDARS